MSGPAIGSGAAAAETTASGCRTVRHASTRDTNP